MHYAKQTFLLGNTGLVGDSLLGTLQLTSGCATSLADAAVTGIALSGGKGNEIEAVRLYRANVELVAKTTIPKMWKKRQENQKKPNKIRLLAGWQREVQEEARHRVLNGDLCSWGLFMHCMHHQWL